MARLNLTGLFDAADVRRGIPVSGLKSLFGTEDPVPARTLSDSPLSPTHPGWSAADIWDHAVDEVGSGINFPAVGEDDPPTGDPDSGVAARGAGSCRRLSHSLRSRTPWIKGFR